MFGEWINEFNPNVDDLFDLLLPQIGDDLLREIAAADYGQDSELHFAPLKRFRDSRIVPILEWHPAEVLELVRWSEPDEPDWKPGAPATRGHLLRAFACSVLLRSYAQPPNGQIWNSFNETAIQLARSLEALNPGLLRAGQSFFAWCVQNLAPLDAEGVEGPFFGLALLSLAARDRAITDEAIVALCQWIDEDVSAFFQEKQAWNTRRKNWLLSSNVHNQKNREWSQLGQTLSAWAEWQEPSDRKTWVALIGQALIED